MRYITCCVAIGVLLVRLDTAEVSGSTWTTVAPMPQGRAGAAYGVIDGKIYIVGGVGGTDAVVNIYDPIFNTWTMGAVYPDGPVNSPAGGGD
jgi:hypothetical protein